MAKCPTCGDVIDHVDTELLELRGYEDVVEQRSGDQSEGRAIATVCPSCESLLSL